MDLSRDLANLGKKREGLTSSKVFFSDSRTPKISVNYLSDFPCHKTGPKLYTTAHHVDTHEKCTTSSDMRVFETLHRVNADASFWFNRDFMNSDKAFGKYLLHAFYFFRNGVEMDRAVFSDSNRHVELQIVLNPIIFFAVDRESVPVNRLVHAAYHGPVIVRPIQRNNPLPIIDRAHIRSELVLVHSVKGPRVVTRSLCEKLQGVTKGNEGLDALHVQTQVGYVCAVQFDLHLGV